MKRQHATSPPPPPAKRNLSSLTSTRAVNLRDWAHANCLTDTPSNPNGRHSITPYLHRISGRRRRRGDAQERRFQGPELDPSPVATGQSDLVTTEHTIASLIEARDALRMTAATA